MIDKPIISNDTIDLYEFKSFLYFLQDNNIVKINEKELCKLEDLIDRWEDLNPEEC